MRIEPDWQALSEHAARLIDVPLRELVAADAARPLDFSVRVGAIYGNFARQRSHGPSTRRW